MLPLSNQLTIETNTPSDNIIIPVLYLDIDVTIVLNLQMYNDCNNL